MVDGGWALQPDGTVRSTQAGYDRLIAFGDVTWTDYLVTAELTFNSFDCDDFGAGIVVGWTGHTYGDPLALSPDQPLTGHPFFGQAGYGTPGTLKIYANSPNYPETTLAQDTSGLKLALGVKYMMKFAVQRTSSTTSEYYLKVWPSSATEPSSWNLQAQGDASHRRRSDWHWRGRRELRKNHRRGFPLKFGDSLIAENGHGIAWDVVNEVRDPNRPGRHESS